jgi:4-amino-4-deoxy-L-arabinose transferase-like glycosyltransferase
MAMPPLRPSIKSSLLGVWWAVFALGYFTRFPFPELFLRLFYLSVLGLLLAASAGLGWAWVRHGLGKSLSTLEQIFFSILTGFGMIGLLMMGLGALGLWKPWAASLLLGGGLLGVIPAKAGIHKAIMGPPPTSAGDDDQRTATGDDRKLWIAKALIALGLVIGFLIAWTPTTYYDSLVYHLALPQAYVQAGRWVASPELIYSAFPQNLEMLWTLGLLLGGDTLSNLIGWAVGILGIGGVFLLGRRFLGRATGLWAAAVLSTMPAYLLLSPGGYVDVGLAVFSLGSFYVLALWSQERRPGILIMAGFLAGIALGIKYTGGIPLLLGAVLILQRNSLKSIRQNLKDLSIYGVVAALAFSPWLMKNLIYVGNPIFPFLHHWSVKALNPWVGEAAAGYFRGLVEYRSRSPWELVRLLWDIAVKGLNFGGGMDVLGDLGWGLLFGLLPVLAVMPKGAKILRWIYLYALGFFILWGMSRPVLRFLLPLAPLLAILTGYVIDRGFPTLTPAVRWGGRGVVLGLWISGFWLFFSVSDLLSLFKVPLGMQTRSEYLAQKLNYYPASVFMDRLPEGSLTYVVGDQRRYYYNTPVIVTPVFNQNPLAEWANQALSPEALREILRRHRITHLLINHAELQRLNQAYRIFPLTPRGKSNWDTLRSNPRRTLYRDAACEVTAL